MNIYAAPLTEAPEAAIPYAPSRKSATRTDAGDSVEIVGQKIIELLNQAVEEANANTKHALDFAQKLSRQLRVAEERVNDLEATLKHYKDRAERAEKWLNFISSEIEQKFFGSADRVRREA
jgi:multidrug resistance efflux pump